MTDVREKLVELLGNLFCGDYGVNGCDSCEYNTEVMCSAYACADHLIANGVTIQRWIPVTERLPEDDLPKGSKAKRIKVQVAYRTNGNWVVRTQVREKGYWYSEPDKWDWTKERDPITHWMPLPDAPEGE